MPNPNVAANTRNITTLALAVAASALPPSIRPTQIALTVPFSDCSTLAISVGAQKRSSVPMIGPRVRSPWRLPGARLRGSLIAGQDP